MKPRHVVCAGASYVEPRSPLVAEVGARLGSATAAGVRGAALGEWTDQAIRHLRPGVLCLVFELGGNGGGTPSLVRHVHGRLKSTGAGVLWVPPMIWPIGGRVGRLRNEVSQAIRDAGVPRVPGPVYELPASDIRSDGVHLSADGYRAFGAHVANNILNAPKVDKKWWWIGGGCAAALAAWKFL